MLSTFKTFVCQIRNSHMSNCSDPKVEFCFAVTNGIVTITLKTINDARAEFFRKHIFKMKMADNFKCRFENDYQQVIRNQKALAKFY